MWNYVYPSYELYHHGVRGQKWGKRNGPPYPLTAGAHSSSEKKAGWKKSLSGGSGDKVRYGNQPSKRNAKKDETSNSTNAVKAVGRGIVKATKATAHGIKKTAEVTSKVAKKAAHVANDVLIRTGKKPVKSMTDEELKKSIERLKTEATYKRALEGKFVDIVQDQQRQHQGESNTKQLMKKIGNEVIFPLATGYLNYKISEAMLGEHDGEINRVKTIMGNRVQLVGDGKKKKKGNGDRNGNGNDGVNIQIPNFNTQEIKSETIKKPKKEKKIKVEVDTPKTKSSTITNNRNKFESFLDNLSKAEPVVSNTMKSSMKDTSKRDFSSFIDTLRGTEKISNTFNRPMSSLNLDNYEDYLEYLSRTRDVRHSEENQNELELYYHGILEHR